MADPLSSLKDDFSDTLDTSTRWKHATGGTDSYTEDGVAVIKVGAAISTSYDPGWDIVGSELLFEIVEMPGDKGRVEVRIYTGGEFSNWVQMSYSANSGNISMWENAGGTTGSKVFDPQDDKWWRIREEDGDYIWETSPDGLTWVQHKVQAVQATPIEGCNVSFVHRVNEGESSSGLFRFDNVNLPPTPPAPGGDATQQIGRYTINQATPGVYHIGR